MEIFDEIVDDESLSSFPKIPLNVYTYSNCLPNQFYVFQIIGLMSTTSLNDAPYEAEKYFEDVGMDWYWLFGGCSKCVLCYAYLSLIFLIASILEWGFTGRFVLARINFVSKFDKYPKFNQTIIE